MNMIAVTDLAAVTRVELLDLEAMPHDPVAIRAARLELSVRDYGVWTILREHLWEYGSLPVGLKSLAKIAGIGVASFERAAPKLARHFDRTTEGAWTDHVLMRARGTSLVVPSPEAPRVDPALSATRSAVGALGGRASAARRQETAQGRRAAEADPGLLRSEANFEAKSEANGDVGRPDFACRGEANGSLAPGLLVGSNEDLSSKTNQPTAGASEANSSAAPQANGEAKPPPDADRDAGLAKAIRDACPGKIEPAIALWGVKIVKGWIAKGCSFEADYLPSLRAFAATNKEVRNVANPIIEAGVFHARDIRLAHGSPRGARPDLARASPETRALHHGLEAKLGEATYLSWGAGIEVLSIDGGLARIGVPTRFVKTWFEGKLERELTAAARDFLSATVQRVAIEVRPAAKGQGDG